MNKNRKAAGFLATGMAAVLGVCPVMADASGPAVSKEETVYVRASADGEVQDVIVSDWLKNSGSTDSCEDVSDLEDIENVKGDETFSQKERRLTWESQGEDIYYQGTSDKELPVDVKLEYELDGRSVSPEELAGKTGHLKMTVSYINHAQTQVQISGKKETVYSPFAMMTGMILPTDVFSNVSVENGKLISDGDKDMVVGFGMPGLKDSLRLSRELSDQLDIPESFTVEADVRDFEMSSTFTVALTDILSKRKLDDISELDDLKDSMEELTDAAVQLMDGAGELRDGTDELNEKYREFYEGIKTLDSGVKELKEGAEQLDEGAGSLQTGARKLESGAAELNDGAASLESGAFSLENGVGSYTAGADTLSKGVKTYTTGVNT